MKCKLKQQQQTKYKLTTNIKKKLDKTCFKKSILSIIKCLINRLLMSFQCKQIGYLQELIISI